jgi:hypothetical protein
LRGGEGDGERKSKVKGENEERKRKSMESIEREQTRGRRSGMGIGNRGETVIDYGIVNEEAWERVEEFKIEERVESYHLEIALRKRRGGKEQKRKGWGMGITLFIFLQLLFYV